MPSYRYTREIKPEDLQPPPPKDYTQKDKAKNWWHYHWVWLAVGVVVVVVAIFFVRDIVTQVKPDVTIGVLCPYALPDVLKESLEAGLSHYVEDLNEDGQVSVMVEVYTINDTIEDEAAAESESIYDAAANTTDPYQQMAGVVRLTAAFESGDPIIFLLAPDSAEFYQSQYQIFGYEDGTLAEGDVPVEEMSVALGDIPGFAGMDLNFTTMDGTEVDGGEALKDFRVGMRAYKGTRIENSDDGAERWAYAEALLQRLMDAA